MTNRQTNCNKVGSGPSLCDSYYYNWASHYGWHYGANIWLQGMDRNWHWAGTAFLGHWG